MVEGCGEGGQCTCAGAICFGDGAGVQSGGPPCRRGGLGTRRAPPPHVPYGSDGQKLSLFSLC